jgi:hypothetical protein
VLRIATYANGDVGEMLTFDELTDGLEMEKHRPMG